MKILPALAMASRWVLALGIFAISGGAASAQNPDITRLPTGGLLAASGFLMFCFVMALVGYVYMAFALQTIANKTKTENAWFAWIPILNVVLMLNIARKPHMVAPSVAGSLGQHRGRRDHLDGRRRSSPQTELVGHSGDHSGSRHHRARVSGVVGLIRPRHASSGVATRKSSRRCLQPQSRSLPSR